VQFSTSSLWEYIHITIYKHIAYYIRLPDPRVPENFREFLPVFDMATESHERLVTLEIEILLRRNWYTPCIPSYNPQTATTRTEMRWEHIRDRWSNKNKINDHIKNLLPKGTSSKCSTGEDFDLISSRPICWANMAGIPWPHKLGTTCWTLAKGLAEHHGGCCETATQVKVENIL